MIGSSLFPPPAPPPDPRICVKGYPWPASRLTGGDMEMLCELREQTGEPLTQLLHEAVSAYYQLLTLEEKTDRGSPHSLPLSYGT